MTTCIEWIQNTTSMLTQAGVDSPKLSAEIILCHILKISRVQLTTYPFEIIAKNLLPQLTKLVKRRLQGEPIAYLLEKKEFFSRNFTVTNSTLIPRPETELLIKFALTHLPVQSIYFADLGTGSGCIAVTLCTERPHWKGFAVDISREALSVARTNALQHNILSQLQYIQADFTTTLLQPETLDLCISNPPYISEEEYPLLSIEIKNFEPVSALIPNKKAMSNTKNITGLEYYEKIIHQAMVTLKPGGILLLEHGATQREYLVTLLKNNIWENVLTHKDFSGKYRFVSAYKYKK